MAAVFAKILKVFDEKYGIHTQDPQSMKMCQMKEFLRKRKELENDKLFISIRKYMLSSSGRIESGDIRMFFEILNCYGFYNLMQQIMRTHPTEINAEFPKCRVMNATETKLNKQLFKYRFSVRDEENCEIYLGFIYYVFSNPHFKHIADSIIHQLFRELSSGIGHSKATEMYRNWEAFYGILLITFPDKILKYVESQSLVQLKKSMLKLVSNGHCCKCCKENVKPMKISFLVKKLKKCVKNEEIFDIGISYLEKVSVNEGRCFRDTLKLIKDRKISNVQDILDGFHLNRSIEVCSLYDRVILFREWVKCDYQKGKYWSGYKILQTAYKLANGYFLQKSFIETEYKTLKRQFIKKLKELTCDGIDCNVKYQRKSPLKPCVGCLKYQFCSKKCQKIHWNAGHNKKCDKEWEREFCSWSDDLIEDKKNVQETEKEIIVSGYLRHLQNEISIEIIDGVRLTIAKFYDVEGNGKITFEMEIPESTDIPYPISDNLMAKMMKQRKSLIPIAGFRHFKDKLMNEYEIVAPKTFILKLEYQLQSSYLLEIKRSKALTRKELFKTVCESYIKIYFMDIGGDQRGLAALYDIVLGSVLFENNICSLNLE